MKLLASIAVALLCAGCAHDDLPNFAQVEPGIYRCGQPTASGWARLKAMGVRYDIKLNPESEASDDLAKAAGIEVIYRPINLWQQTLGEPDQAALGNAVFAIIAGCVVHCSHGQDRTGEIIGLYRFWVEHWSKEQAYAEMRAHGFHPELIGLQRAWNHAEMICK